MSRSVVEAPEHSGSPTAGLVLVDAGWSWYLFVALRAGVVMRPLNRHPVRALLSLVLLAALAVALSACGGKKATPPKAASEAPEKAAKVEAPAPGEAKAGPEAKVAEPAPVEPKAAPPEPAAGEAAAAPAPAEGQEDQEAPGPGEDPGDESDQEELPAGMRRASDHLSEVPEGDKASPEACAAACANAVKVTLEGLGSDATETMRQGFRSKIEAECPKACAARGSKASAKCIAEAKTAGDLPLCPL